jgi:hypothetical protein
MNYGVVASKAEISHQSHLLGQLGIIGRDRPALEPVEKFRRRLKLKTSQASEISDAAARMQRPEGMRSVEQQAEAALGAEGLQLRDRGGPAP